MKIYYQDSKSIVFFGDCNEVVESDELPVFDTLITDPPYGIGLGKHRSGTDRKKAVLHKVANYDDSLENFQKSVVPGVLKALSRCDRGMVFCVPPSMWLLPAPQAIGGVFCPSAMGRNKWGWSNFIHCLLYGMAPEIGKGAYPTGISSTKAAEKTGHPLTKPQHWMEWAVRLGTRPGMSVLDPFCGSGSTLVACKKYDIFSVGIDIDEASCEIAAKRLESMQ